MGKLFNKFLNGEGWANANRLEAGFDLFLGHGLPWAVAGGFFFCGVYGLESYLAIDFSQKFVENLKKNNMLSDAQKDFYTALGDKVLEKSAGEKEYEKMKNKKFGNMPVENSLLAKWKEIYDK